MRFNLFLTIILSTILITSESPQVDIKDAGVGFINEGDIALLFYITLENKSREVYEICASMIQCCETSKPQQNDCSHIRLIGGHMGLLYSKSTKNITLIYPNLYLYNRQGMCTVAVKYQNQNLDKEITAEIDFRTPKRYCPDLPSCPALDTDPEENCSPVDCVIKYSGEMSYFNPICRDCQKVPICISDPGKCVPDVSYSVSSNNCTQLTGSISKDDLGTLENMLGVNRNQGPEDFEECDASLQTNFICHHGNLYNGVCVCQSDWVTTTDDEVYQPSLLQYHMCNIEVGAWNCVNKGKIRTTALLITIFAVTIASKILILMCILNWCYKYMRSKRRTCSDKLDPFDESIIICDTIDSFEQCLCSELPSSQKKKTDRLKSETVNVSFYPCAPSGFSSVHVSSGSEKGKCSIKSEPSIVLSNTTSSSVRVSFETDTDTTNVDSEEDDEEGNYDIEFVGEGEEEEEEDEDDEDLCICGEEEDVKKTTSSVVPAEEDSEYTASIDETSRKPSASSKSRTASEKTLSSKKSIY